MQIQHVIDQELNDVKMKIKRIYQKCGQTDQEKIGFVLLNKKTNTRLFAMKGRTAENPDPGTVVDDVITLPERWFFSLSLVFAFVNLTYLFYTGTTSIWSARQQIKVQLAPLIIT